MKNMKNFFLKERPNRTKIIVINIKTKDALFKSEGANFKRQDIKILGVGTCFIYSWGYSDPTYFNLISFAEKTFKDLQNIFNNSVVVGYNIEYSILGLKSLGFNFESCFLLDIMLLQGLINESEPSFSLNELAKKHLKIEKTDYVLKLNARKKFYGRFKQENYLNYLDELDQDVVGISCLQDVNLIKKLFLKQCKELDGLIDFTENPIMNNSLISIESNILQILVNMKEKGTPFLESKLEIFVQNKKDSLKNEFEAFQKNTGINIWQSESLISYCQTNKIIYPTTLKNNVSFMTVWLENHVDENLRKVGEFRRKYSLINHFLEGIRKISIKGNIYPSFYSFKSENGGTVTGRFSCKNPNLQQIEKHDENNIRSFFGREDCIWISFDYSQIELRIFAHYTKSQLLIEAYKNNEDVHQKMANIIECSREKSKMVTFGLIYGMGINSLSQALNITTEEAKQLKIKYFNLFPEIKNLMILTRDVANKRGYVKTILGRKRHFYKWQESYKAINFLIQGSASDVFKKALVNLDREGVFRSKIGYPVNLVHDEVQFCFAPYRNMNKDILKIKNILETPIDLRVPLKVNIEYGNSWGELKEYEI